MSHRWKRKSLQPAAKSASPSAAVSALYSEATRLCQAKRYREVQQLCRQALSRHPAHHPSIHLLALAHFRQGDTTTAIQLIQQALQLAPGTSAYIANLGLIQAALQNHRAAIHLYMQALALDPHCAEVHYNLAESLYTLGQDQEALDALRVVRRLAPKDKEALILMARLFQGRALLAEARDCLEMALELQPDSPECLSSLGELLLQSGSTDEGSRYLNRAIELNPQHAHAYVVLGQFRTRQGKTREALLLYEQGLKFQPDNSTLQILASHCRLATGQSAAAYKHLAAIRAYASRLPDAHSVLLFTSHHDQSLSPGQLLEDHRGWARRHADWFYQPRNWPARAADKRLRIGYVSGDFRSHPVSFFLAPILEQHDKSQVEVFAYSNSASRDSWTERIERCCEHWRGISTWSDDLVTRQIETDEIDILVDLSGHTNLARLLVFARKPAPVQISWLGYFNTTGMRAMDYILVDPVIAPAHEIPPFAEAPLCLERGYLCWQLPPSGPDTKTDPIQLPALRTGRITYGCCNNLAKITPQVVEVWSRLLVGQPTARLILKTTQLDDERTCQLIAQQFLDLGVKADQLELQPASPRHELLQLYRETIDMVLDPFPYNGGTTTCEALSQGVPVISLRGDRFVSRIGASILTYAGLPELITETEEDYINLALEFSRDLDRLARLRQELPSRLAASALCDTKGFVEELESGYRLVWRHWCETASRTA